MGSDKPSSFRVHQKDSIIPIMEEMETSDDSYRHAQISPEDTFTAAHERGMTTKIVIGAIDQGHEEETYETKTPETCPGTPATLATYPLQPQNSEGIGTIPGAITPAPPTPRDRSIPEFSGQGATSNTLVNGSAVGVGVEVSGVEAVDT